MHYGGRHAGAALRVRRGDRTRPRAPAAEQRLHLVLRRAIRAHTEHAEPRSAGRALRRCPGCVPARRDQTPARAARVAQRLAALRCARPAGAHQVRRPDSRIDHPREQPQGSPAPALAVHAGAGPKRVVDDAPVERPDHEWPPPRCAATASRPARCATRPARARREVERRPLGSDAPPPGRCQRAQLVRARAGVSASAPALSASRQRGASALREGNVASTDATARCSRS